MASSSQNWKKLRYTVTPSNKESTSSAAGFYRILAICTWVCGLILAIAAAAGNNERYTGISSALLFVALVIPFGILGGVLYGQAEMLQNIKIIADAISHLNVYAENESVSDDAPKAEKAARPADASISSPAGVKDVPISDIRGAEDAEESGHSAWKSNSPGWVVCPTCNELITRDFIRIRKVCPKCGERYDVE